MLNIPEEVKRALRAGDLRKNYKMKVNDVDPDTGARTYAYTIDNDTIVKESVKIDERMVTGKNLKFGLCEGSSLEFQYFNHPNTNGKDIQVYISIEYVNSSGNLAWYDIPMGWYTVDQCPVQWDTGIYKVTAYNKLRSGYLDQKANASIVEIVEAGELGGTPGTATMDTILMRLLEGYTIGPGFSKAIYTVPSNWSITQGYLSYYDTPNGNYVCAVEGTVYINISNLSPNGEYRLYANRKKIREAIWESLGETYLRNQYVRDPNYPSDEFAKLYDVTCGVAGHCVSDPYVSIRDLNSQTLLRCYLAQYGDGSDEYVSDFTQKKYIEDSVWLQFPMIFLYGYMNPVTAWNSLSTSEKNAIKQKWTDFFSNGENFRIEVRDSNGFGEMEFTTAEVEAFSDVTLRELQSAVYEISCQYGQMDRETDMFSGVELNQSGLYPADTLYPANTLYPQGNMVHPFPSSYSKLWTDTIGEQSFRYLIITYKTTENGQEVEKTLQRTVNTYGTTNYNMSDNWVFRNLIWTASDVGDYADAMVLKMKDIRWFPFELWGAGLPHIETGDAIEITDKNGNTHTSYVLTRTLDGIQDLQDTFINGELDIF